MVLNGQVGSARTLLLAAVLLIAAETPFEPARAEAAQSTNGSGSGMIAGTVSADDGALLRRARVVLRTGDQQDVAAAFTDASGGFVFSGLGAGTYYVTASQSRFVTAAYGRSARSELGSPIRLDVGQAVRNIDVRLQRGAVISGTIVNDFGTPMTGVRVVIARADARTSERRIVVVRETDDRGGFRAWGLPDGHYYVGATLTKTSSNAGLTYYPGTRVAPDARAVAVKAGQEISGVSFVLPAGASGASPAGVSGSAGADGGVISGIVFDDTGDPAVGARVLIRPRNGPISDEQPDTTGLTDDRGEFRVWGITPGEYIVGALPPANPPGWVNLLLNSPEYAETYYPGFSSPNDALPVVLDPGATVGGIGFKLQLVQLVDIAGSVVDVDGVAVRSGVVSLVPDEGRSATATDAADRSLRVTIDADGRFELERVPTGNYTLEAAAATRGGIQYGAASLAVLGHESDLQLAVSRLRAVSGVIVWDSGVPGGFAPQALRITAPRIHETLAAPLSAAAISPTGTFAIRDVLPGSHVIRVENVPTGWVLRSVFIGSREATGSAFDLQGDQDLEDVRLVFAHVEP